MTRESVHEKGRRYLIEGRVIVEYVNAGTIRATCRGGGDAYRLGLEEGVWWCSCPARTRCAHLVALGLVTVRPPGREADAET